MRCLTEERLSTLYLTKSLWCLMKHGPCVWLCCSLSSKGSEMSFETGFLVFLCYFILPFFCLFVCFSVQLWCRPGFMLFKFVSTARIRERTQPQISFQIPAFPFCFILQISFAYCIFKPFTAPSAHLSIFALRAFNDFSGMKQSGSYIK